MRAAAPVSRADLALLAAATLLAALMRLRGLDAGLWYDEVLTLVEFVRLPLSESLASYGSLNNHVFFTLQAHLSVALFGESPWALRLPAALLGIAGVPALWLLVRRAGGPAVWAHGAAFLLALSYHHIWFSQNARGYTGLFFWGVVATTAFLAAARGGSLRAWILAGTALGLAMYTHLSAAFLVLALGLLALPPWLAALAGRGRPGLPGLAGAGPVLGFGLAGGLALLLHAPMLGEMAGTFAAASAPEGQVVAAWNNPLWTLLEILRSLPVPLAATLAALPVLLGVLGLGAAAVWRREPLLLLLLLVHAAVTLLALLALGMRIWPRYFLFDLALVLVLAVAGSLALGDLLARLAGRPGLGRALGLLGLAAGILVSVPLALRNHALPKQDFAGAVALVEARRAPGEVAASFGLAALPVSAHFAPSWAVVADAAALARLRATAPGVWLLGAFPAHSRARHADILAALATGGWEEVAELPGTLGGGEVTVWHASGPAPGP